MSITTPEPLNIPTHDPAGGGSPRLQFSLGDHHDRDATPLSDFELQPGTNTIGSHEQNDLRLEGLEDFHAEIRRDSGDDYVLVSLVGEAGLTVHGRPASTVELHTGTRIELGRWVVSYARDESADHGRPHGGRQGGELSSGPRVGA